MDNADQPEPGQPAPASGPVGAGGQQGYMSGAAGISPVRIILAGLVGVAIKIAGLFIVVGVATR